jgi:hypothetical protein
MLHTAEDRAERVSRAERLLAALDAHVAARFLARAGRPLDLPLGKFRGPRRPEAPRRIRWLISWARRRDVVRDELAAATGSPVPYVHREVSRG